MKIIELDLTGCRGLSEIHERIRIAFGFPEWYGKNWNAFWDLLWSECDADGVVVKGEKDLPEEFENSLETMYKILERNASFRKENKLKPFVYKIEN